jgi:hypothetical protein
MKDSKSRELAERVDFDAGGGFSPAVWIRIGAGNSAASVSLPTPSTP